MENFFDIATTLNCFCIFSLPCFAFIFCIIYSWFNHYEWVTRTHCLVWNIAPSISGLVTNLSYGFYNVLVTAASIGNFAPQKYVWKLCIAMHSAPRLLTVLLYHNHLNRVLDKSENTKQLIFMCCFFNVVEIFSLLLLSIVPSVEDFHLHKLSFVSFLLFSALFIGSSYYLQRYLYFDNKMS